MSLRPISARSHADYLAELAGQRAHRQPIPDLIIAATAEIHGATVLHVDNGYQTIAAVTDQPHHRLKPGDQPGT
ncbi:hypothetical protein [Nocardia sp. NPDC051463]|uniref:hypothetical protein n=1 Tax=Nocardia sp. NPDC051463 TaxID=3154845 RepID=UPI00343E3542